jgi:hypothetical protein
MTKNTKTLPRKIIALKNADKSFHEKWTATRDPLNLPHPVRGVFLGPPNTGKTTVIKNILLRAKPPYEEIFVVHADPEYTKEYDDLDCTMLGEIPAPEEWEGEVKTCVILDDIEFSSLSKEQKKHLDRLFGYVSTHKNISVFLTSQQAFSVPTICRRCSNLFVIYKQPDVDSLKAIARKVGMKTDQFVDIFDNLLKVPTDSLWIDLTNKSPHPLRLNGYEMLERQK